MSSNPIPRKFNPALRLAPHFYMHTRDTNYDYSIQTWALEEARRRLEAEGILEDPAKVKK